jgi:hypothetical protein
LAADEIEEDYPLVAEFDSGLCDHLERTTEYSFKELVLRATGSRVLDLLVDPETGQVAHHPARPAAGARQIISIRCV